MSINITSKTSDGAEGPRDKYLAMRRGATHRCPSCGKGRLYGSFLKIVDRCGECSEELFHHRADDAPPYFTMLITGHLLVAGALSLEKAFSPPTWIHIGLWIPLTIIVTLALLPRIKGAMVGLQWALRMHGFSGDEREVNDGGLRPRST
ncbi:MAG TPA: DUF983 domain-containing protein [Rhodobacteraceae bacterium]|nr:DUF983 domain-containing protein [Paracoccaceae bacterium]